MIGKIEKVPLRDIWKHEAHDFTKWLQDNIDVLSDVINLPLTNVEREQTTGNFYVDLTAEDNSGKTVIIENQLEKSNHDHLGKSKREKKERYILRKDFWTIVLNKLKDRTNLFNAVSPSESSWLGAGSGKRGIQYTMWVTQEEARLSLYIDRGKDSEEENQSILKKLEQQNGCPQIPTPSSIEVSSLTPMWRKSIRTRVNVCVKSFRSPLKSTLSGAV